MDNNNDNENKVDNEKKFEIDSKNKSGKPIKFQATPDITVNIDPEKLMEALQSQTANLDHITEKFAKNLTLEEAYNALSGDNDKDVEIPDNSDVTELKPGDAEDLADHNSNEDATETSTAGAQSLDEHGVVDNSDDGAIDEPSVGDYNQPSGEQPTDGKESPDDGIVETANGAASTGEDLPAPTENSTGENLPAAEGKESDEKAPANTENGDKTKENVDDGKTSEQDKKEDENPAEKKDVDQAAKDQMMNDYFAKKQQQKPTGPEKNPLDGPNDLGQEQKDKNQRLNDKTNVNRNNPLSNDEENKDKNNLAKKPEEDAKQNKNGENGQKDKNKDQGNAAGDGNKQKSASGTGQSGTSQSKKNGKEKKPSDVANRSKVPESSRRKGRDPRENFSAKNAMNNLRNNIKNRAKNAFGGIGGSSKSETEKGEDKSTSTDAIAKFIKFIKKHPYMLGAVVGLVCVVFFIVVIGVGFSSDGTAAYYAMTSQSTYYLAPNFSNVMIKIVDSEGNVVEDNISIEQYTIGMAMIDLNLNADTDLTDAQIEAYLLLAKTKILESNNYSDTNNYFQITIGTDNYCNPYYGCDKYEDGSNVYYYSSETTVDKVGDLKESISPLPDELLSTLITDYENVSYYVLLPDSKTDDITSFSSDDYPTDILNSTIINTIKNSDASDYKTIIENIDSLDAYEVIDGEPLITVLTTTGCDGDWWWPIGNAGDCTTNSSGVEICSGTPQFTHIRAYNGENGHRGIDIGAESGSSQGANVIASRGGTVVKMVNNVTKQYTDAATGSTVLGRGNYVEIDHGDGTYAYYQHMEYNSITVKVGDTVVQGQKLGTVGNTGHTLPAGTGFHLHFQVTNNIDATHGTNNLNPLDYVSQTDTRPTTNCGTFDIPDDASTQQEVCLTLKNLKYNDEAIAAIMGNIQREDPTWGLTTLGDKGTSIGLCQFHATNMDGVKKKCGSTLPASCQMEYLDGQLRSGGYNNLLTIFDSDKSVYEKAMQFCRIYEKPASCTEDRGTYAEEYYNFVKNDCKN